MEKKRTKVVVKPDGTCVSLKTNEMNEIFDFLVDKQSTRASHIIKQEDGYYADLRLSGGPVIGPFETRELAIEHEVGYINEYLDKFPMTNLVKDFTS